MNDSPEPVVVSVLARGSVSSLTNGLCGRLAGSPRSGGAIFMVIPTMAVEGAVSKGFIRSAGL